MAISHPKGDGLASALKNALKSAKVEPQEVDYINAHATSTPIGDVSEAKAIRRIFSAVGARPAISSTKALTGHGLSLAGAMETGFCALAMRHGFMPGSAHITDMEPAVADLNIIQETVDSRPQVVVNNSSGFGGANVALVLRAVPSVD